MACPLLPLGQLPHLPPHYPDPTVTLAAAAAAAQPASNAGRAVPCTGGDVRWQAKITTLHVTLPCTWRNVESKTQIVVPFATKYNSVFYMQVLDQIVLYRELLWC